jgi:hypothetical protein
MMIEPSGGVTITLDEDEAEALAALLNIAITRLIADGDDDLRDFAQTLERELAGV